jgi:hypothetical protein
LTKPYNQPDNEVHPQINNHIIVQVVDPDEQTDETSVDKNPAIKAENDRGTESENGLIAEKGYVNNFL